MADGQPAYGPTRWRHRCVVCGRKFFTIWRYSSHYHAPGQGTIRESSFIRGRRKR